MKKFLIGFVRLVLVLAIVVVIDFAVGKIDRFVFEHENQSTPDYLTTVSQCEDDIIIIGSSTARHHYIPRRMQDSLGLSVYNAGLDGSFFVIQNCVINHLLDHANPRYILWEIGEDCLSDNMPVSREYQKMDILYHYYDEPYIREAIDKRDKWQRFRMISNMYRVNSKIIHDFLSLIKIVLNKNSNVANIGGLKGYSPLPNEGYEYPKVGSDLVNESINPEKETRLINTILECKRRNIQLIFTSSPRHYNGDVLKLKQANELKRIAQEEGIPYFVYYDDQDIANNNDFFKDCDHLNARGAEAYMDVFIPALRSEILKLSN